MKSEKRKRHLMKRDITVQVERGGVRQAVRGVLHRSARRSDLSRWRKVKGHLLDGGRSLLAFASGLLLASLYGVTALFLQKQPLWLCVYTTLTVAAMAAFGMGLSASVRANVSVLLPSLCSGHGRKFLFFLFVSVLLNGPLTNTLENTERAAASLLCGVELAANQTQELMQRAATPLFSRTLRNVLHFLVHIGDVCNATLGSPYKKCRAVFAEARADCSDLLGEFNFLCDIVDSFLPLCGLARAGELFCTIPSYIASHLRKRLAAPAVAAFERMKREFDFNISASVTFDVDANISRSLQQVSQDIMDEFSSELQVFQKLSEPLVYGGLVLLACSFMRYLRELDFDNFYITAQFEEIDRQLTARERRAVLVGVASVFRHLVMGGLLVALDFLVFWMLDQVHHQVKGDVVARAPVTVAVQVNGSGYASDIFRDLVTSFDVLQRGNVTVISRKCLLEPSEPDYVTCFILGLLLGLALLVSVTAGFVQRCRRLVCASYHPERELERIRFLRQQILDQRREVGRALRRSAARSRADRGGGGRKSRLQTLLLRLPGGVHLSHLLGLSSVSCLSCGEVLRQDEENMAACDVPQCPGVYCRPCFHSLGNTCVVCTRPLTCQEDSEDELGSSDDEEQLNSTHISDGKLIRRTVSTATRQKPAEGSESQMRTVKDEGESDSRALINVHSELSEADMTCQGRPASDDSDAGATKTSGLQTVIIHRPDCPQDLQDSPGPSRTLQDPVPNPMTESSLLV
ncbi:hypothetical protein ABVT39_023547 [Epinephelus coioides]